MSAAARALQSTQPTIGRQVTALEQDLGVTLFERSGRSLLMTGAGQDLLEHVQAMGDAASRISMVASGQSQDVAGHVSITASDLLAAGFLPPILKKLRQEAPGIIVDVIASNRIENLTRRDADIAIRHVRPDQPDLIARQMTDAQAGYYAATEYLERYGRPKSVADLKDHVFVGPRDTTQMLQYLEMRGIELSPDQFKANSDSGVVMWEMMRAGLGIVVGPSGIWPDTKGVEQLLADVDSIAFPVWLATHRELKTSRRIRIVFDTLAAAFSGPHGLKMALD